MENQQQREAFLAARKGKIGSSDIGTVVGLNPFCTPLKLWMQMTGKLDAVEDNDPMWLGRQMEPIVAQMYARETGKAITKCNLTFTREKFPNVCATPDYLYEREPAEYGILECKTTKEYMKKKWTDGVPDSYHCQVLWQQGITELHSEAVIAVLVGGAELQHYPVEFNKDIFQHLYEKSQEFLWHVQNDKPPAPTGDDKKLIDKLVQHQEGCEVKEVDDPYIVSLAQQWHISKQIKSDLEREAKLSEKEAKRLENEMRLLMGEAGAVRAGEYLLTAKTVKHPGSTTLPYEYTKFNIKG